MSLLIAICQEQCDAWPLSLREAAALIERDVSDTCRVEAVLLGREESNCLLDTTVKFVNLLHGIILTSFDIGDLAISRKFGHGGRIPWCRGRWAQRV
jgi:hypothetical protein